MAKPVISGEQRKHAEYLYRLALDRGLPAPRAREFAEAAFRESGLNPNAAGPPVAQYGGRRARGYFQLLSDGYVRRAEQLGGVTNPRANALAILPDYAAYWQSHPKATPGEAAAAVERSGQPASFYDVPDQVFPLAGGAATGGAPLPQAAPTGASAGAPDPRRAFALAIMGNGSRAVAPAQLLAAIQQLRATQSAAPIAGPVEPGGAAPTVSGGIKDAFYTPLGSSVDNGRFVKGYTIAGHGDHGHVSFTSPDAARYWMQEAVRRGLSVRENPLYDKVDPVHVKGSDHYRTFKGTNVGAAEDVSGDPAALRAYMQLVMRGAA